MLNAKLLNNGCFEELESVVSDGINFERIKFEFPKSWEGYLKTAVFSNENEAYSVILQEGNPLCISENECYIPFEVLKPGIFYLSVFGTKGDSRATAQSVPVYVLESGYTNGEKPGEPTLTQYEQLVNLVTETKRVADAVKADADNGAFKGDKGDKGDTGEHGPKGDAYVLTEADKNEIMSLVLTNFIDVSEVGQ